jgi:phage FluMu protein Com
MTRASRRILFAGLLLALPAALTLGGCASTDKSDASADADQGTAMMCPKCETVWVTESKQLGAKTRIYQSKAEMTCPTCDKMAKAYFEDNKVVPHDCPDCKVTPTIVTPRERPVYKNPIHR